MTQEVAPLVAPIAKIAGSIAGRDVEARDPNWKQFEQGFKEGFDGTMKAAATILPAVAALARREPSKAGWQKFENGVETVGKDAWHVTQEVAPLVAPIVKIAGAVGRRDPSWKKFEQGVENAGKDVWHVVQEAAPVVEPIAKIASKFARDEQLSARDPSFWDTLKKDFGKVEHVVSEAAPVVEAGVKVASMFARNEQLSARDEEFVRLAARDPSFWDSVKKDFGKVEHVVSEAAPVVEAGVKIASKFARDEESLLARDPKINWKTVGKDVLKGVEDVAPLAALAFRDEEHIAARDPKINWGNVGKDVLKGVEDVAPLAALAFRA